MLVVGFVVYLQGFQQILLGFLMYEEFYTQLKYLLQFHQLFPGNNIQSCTQLVNCVHNSSLNKAIFISLWKLVFNSLTELFYYMLMYIVILLDQSTKRPNIMICIKVLWTK